MKKLLVLLVLSISIISCSESEVIDQYQDKTVGSTVNNKFTGTIDWTGGGNETPVNFLKSFTVNAFLNENVSTPTQYKVKISTTNNLKIYKDADLTELIDSSQEINVVSTKSFYIKAETVGESIITANLVTTDGDLELFRKLTIY